MPDIKRPECYKPNNESRPLCVGSFEYMILTEVLEEKCMHCTFYESYEQFHNCIKEE